METEEGRGWGMWLAGRGVAGCCKVRKRAEKLEWVEGGGGGEGGGFIAGVGGGWGGAGRIFNSILVLCSLSRNSYFLYHFTQHDK